MGKRRWWNSLEPVLRRSKTALGCLEALFTPRPLGPLYDIAAQTQGNLATLMSRETDRPTLFSAFLEELQKSPLPTVVVFEDVHWADEATLAFAHQLVSRQLQFYRTGCSRGSAVA